MDFGGRKELFRAVTGSHNYNMNTPDSDIDYKIFLLPTFDDLYYNKQFSKSYIGKTEDFSIHDIRKVSIFWWKSNINFIETLFSINIQINENLKYDTKCKLKEIFDYKDKIARMNLPYLYNSCIGTHLSKKNLINKGTEGTKYLVEKYGYDTKQAMHSIRVLDFIHRFADNNFTDFKKAIWYENDDNIKKDLINLKSGKYSKDSFEELANKYYIYTEETYKDKYCSEKPDEEIYNYLSSLIKDIVTNELI